MQVVEDDEPQVILGSSGYNLVDWFRLVLNFLPFCSFNSSFRALICAHTLEPYPDCLHSGCKKEKENFAG